MGRRRTTSLRGPSGTFSHSWATDAHAGRQIRRAAPSPTRSWTQARRSALPSRYQIPRPEAQDEACDGREMIMPNDPTEPAADLRQMASMLWQTFIALQQEGFNEHQALVILGQVLAAAVQQGPTP